MCYNTDMKKRMLKKQKIGRQIIVIALILLGVLVVNAMLEKVTIVEYPSITEKNDRQPKNNNQSKP